MSYQAGMQLLRRHSLWLHLLGLFVLWLVVLGYRASFGFASPLYEPDELNPFYPAEAAIQYRWASMVAQGNELPSVDFRAQYPEGLRFWTDITPVLELSSGISYRAFKEVTGARSFLNYSIWFIAAVASLPIIVAWASTCVIGQSRAAGWLAALLLAVHPLGLERVVRNFGRENLALVFVFLPVFGLVLAWRWAGLSRGRVIAGIAVAVVSQVLAFASWHLSRALFEITVVVLVFMALFRMLSGSQRRIVAAWLCLLVPAYFLIPALRVRGFVSSPGVLVGHALVIYELLRGRLQSVWIRLLLALAATGALAVWLQPKERDSHVLAVIIAKIRFLLIKPEDPASLSPEARMMWIEAFHSPSLAQVVTYIVPLLLLVVSSALLGKEGILSTWRQNAGLRLIAILTFVWLAGFALIYRLHVMAVPCLCVLCGVLGARVLQSRQSKLMVSLTAFVILFFGWQSATYSRGNIWLRVVNSVKPAHNVEPFVNLHRDTVSLLRWIREQTEPNAVFASWFGLSSLIYAYADRPVVVQSKFENPTVRTKVAQLAEALYSPETVLAEFCRRYGVSYIVYEVPLLLSAATDSVRYVAGHQTVTSEMAVFLMHFQPYDLENFELVYQNGGFRVFEFLKSKQQQYRNLPIGWEGVYERDFYGIDSSEPYDDRRTTSAVMAIRQMDMARLTAEALASEGRYPEAKRILEQVLAKEPRFWQGWLTLARAAEGAGDPATVRRAAAGVLKGYPKHEEALRFLNSVNRPESKSGKR